MHREISLIIAILLAMISLEYIYINLGGETFFLIALIVILLNFLLSLLDRLLIKKLKWRSDPIALTWSEVIDLSFVGLFIGFLAMLFLDLMRE